MAALHLDHEVATPQHGRSDLLSLGGRLPAGVFCLLLPLLLALTLLLRLSHGLLGHVRRGSISAPLPDVAGLWRRQGLIYIAKASTVSDNLPTCRGLIHIDLQMK